MITDEQVEAALVAFWCEPIPEITMRDRMRAALEVGCGPCIEELATALRDMCENFEEASQYKGEYLARKHRDAEQLDEARSVLTRWGLEK